MKILLEDDADLPMPIKVAFICIFANQKISIQMYIHKPQIRRCNVLLLNHHLINSHTVLIYYKNIVYV